MFSSLKIREFRMFWMAMFVSLIGTWVQTMAQSWLVFQLTRSAFLMGLVGFLGYLPVSLFSLPAGVIVDRVPKRNLIILTQSVFTFLAFLLASLVQRGTVQIWHIMVIASLNGMVLSFDAPARQSMVVEMVGRQHLLNAVALNSAVFNSARIIGPALAGILIASIGLSGCFMVNALSYLPVIAVLFFIKPAASFLRNNNNTFLEDIQESFSLLKSSKVLMALLFLVGLVSTFGVSFLVLMPIFAQGILGSGAAGLAVLMSSSGLGALWGALHVAGLQETASKFRRLNFCVLVFFASAMLFAFSRDLATSCFALVLAGYGAAGSMSLANVFLQLNIPDTHRGRLMSIFVMIFLGFIPFGNLIFGTLAQIFGAAGVVFAGAFVCCVLYLGLRKRLTSL